MQQSDLQVGVLLERIDVQVFAYFFCMLSSAENEVGFEFQLNFMN